MDLSPITIKTAAIGLCLVILWTLESLIPIAPGRRKHGRHYLHNLALGAGNVLLVSLLFGTALLTMLELSGRYSFGLLHGLSLGAAPSMLLAFLMLDAWQYAWHVINHRIPLLWRFHAVHHSDGEMDASSAVRFHTGEVMLSHLARLAVLPLLGVTPLDLLIYESVMFPVILFHHSNLRIPERLDRGLRWVIVTPGMHWLHHSDEIRETNSNYASVFSLWDRLGRTYAVRRLPAEVSLGLKGLTRADWNSLGAALKLPFKRNRP